jgi:iron complex outermembrane recepter protein
MNFGADKQYYYGGAMSGMAEGGSDMSGMSSGESGMDMPDTGDMPGMMSSEIAPGMPMNTRAKNLGASIGADFGLSSRDIMRVGAEYQNYRYNDWWPPSPPGGTGMMAPDTFLEINDGRRDRADAYVEWDRAWTSAWTSQVGVRSDTVMMDTGKVHGYNAMYDAPPLFPATTFNDADRSRVDPNWDVTAQAVYRPDLTETYSFGYSRKTRSPNLYERYSWSPDTMAAEMIGWFGDGNFYIGNLDLDPEVAHTVSGTADLHDASRTMGIEVTPYYSYVSDYIDVRRCPTGVCGDTQAVIDSLTARQGFVYLQFINQDAQLFGVDVAGRALLAENTRLGTFTARGLLSYVEGTNIVTDDHLYHMMPVNGKIALEQRVGRWTNVIETVLVGEKFLVSQVHNEVETGAYALLNLRSSYQWNNLRVDFGIENLFDTFYDLPLGGLYLGQGATMAADGIPWGVALPGMGRSVYVATNLKF